MITYPKIETLYVRDEKTHKIDPSKIRLPEFGLPLTWQITEKIAGTNIRVTLLEDGSIKIAGRTDAVQIYGPLVELLYQKFTPEKMKAAFWIAGEPPFEVQLFGEGYGEKIQKGGGNYRKGISLRLFDVLIGRFWLRWNDVENIAQKFGIRTVPLVGNESNLPKTGYELRQIIPRSEVAVIEADNRWTSAEGIVAREPNGLLMRDGRRLMWKLKFSDFANGL